MGTLEACPPLPLVRRDGFDRPLIVVGVTHPQTCLVLRGRLRALREAGLSVVLIAGAGSLAARIAAEEGVASLTIPMNRGISPLADLVSLWRLYAALRRLRPVLAEFSTPKAGLLGNIAGLLCRVPVRVYVLRGLRLETASGWHRRVLKITERLAAACCHHVVCNSESLRAEALALGMAPERKLILIGNGSSAGVDVRRFTPAAAAGTSEVRTQLGIAADEPVIGYVGRLTRDKGIHELLRAFERILAKSPQAWLLLVGWFDDSDDALGLVQRAWIGTHPRILSTGFVSDTAPFYHAMDLLVLPTWREGLPNVALEAAASGLPVISTQVTGARDAVVDNYTGLLVQPGDARALAGAVEQLLTSPGLRRKMGNAGRAWVSERFVHTRVQSLTVALYRKLILSAGKETIAAMAGKAAAAGD